MFKNSSENFARESKQQVKAQCPRQITNDLLEFWARQINILRDIAECCLTVHPDVIIGRLQECIHLLQKKLAFALNHNPEQYHDYIQDFYDNQLNRLRAELNTCKLSLGIKDRQLADLRLNYNLLSSQVEAEKEKSSFQIGDFQEKSKLKKQLQHCHTLIEQNNSFISEQGQTIETLSEQIQSLQMSNSGLRKKYEQKVFEFQEKTKNYENIFILNTRKLQNISRQYQQDLKQMALFRLKLIQQKNILCRQLEIKNEENRISTKKIYEQQLAISKLQKQLATKCRVNEQLYGEIDEFNQYRVQEREREEKSQEKINMMKEQIYKLENKVKEKMIQNDQMSKRISQLQKQCEVSDKNGKKMRKKLQQLEQWKEENENKMEQLEKQKKSMDIKQNKMNKQKERLTQQLKLMELRYQQQYEQSNRDRQSIKKGVLVQVNQLVAITKKQQNCLKQMKNKVLAKEEELQKEKVEKQAISMKFQQMSELVKEINMKIGDLRKENEEIRGSKVILEEQLYKTMQDLQKLKERQSKNQIQKQQNEKKKVKQLQDLKTKYEKDLQIMQEQMNRSSKQQNEFLQSTPMSLSRVDEEYEVKFQQVERQKNSLKQSMHKKDFQIRELEMQMRILQEEITDNKKYFQHEKGKMMEKIRELEELLASGFSDSGRN